MVEQSAIGVLLSNCVTGVDYSRRSAEVFTVTTSHHADLCVLHGLCNTRINPTSVSYFLLSPDLQIILPRLELILWSLNNILFYEFHIDYKLGELDRHFGWNLRWKLSLCCLRSVHRIRHANCCRQHKEEVNPAVFTFLVRRNKTLFAVDECRKASLIQDPNRVFLLIFANSIDIWNPQFMVLSL